MPSIAYTIVDAFTSRPFKGNPASVVVLPSGHSLSQASTPTSKFIEIAAEFNLSETAFIIPVQDQVAEKELEKSRSFRLRWFTPTLEVSLCGHATLASARVLFGAADLVPSEVHLLKFETLSGTLTARRIPEGNQIELEFPALRLEVVDDLVKEMVEQAVKKAIKAPEHVPDNLVQNIQLAKSGILWKLLVHLHDSFDLESATIDASAFAGLDPYRAVILTCTAPSKFTPDTTFISRVFAPLVGVPEDPVTGAAHCALTPYWSQALRIPAGQTMRARQVSPRGGDLEVVWDKERDSVVMRGDAVVVATGEMVW